MVGHPGVGYPADQPGSPLPVMSPRPRRRAEDRLLDPARVTQLFLVVALITIGTAAILQTILGNDPLVTLLASATALVTLVPIWLNKLDNIVGIFFTFVLFYWSLTSLILKSILVQRLDSYLYSPLLTHLIIFAAVSAFVAAAVVVRFLLLRTPKIIWPVPTPRQLRLISAFSIALGCLGLVLAQLGGQAQALSVFLTSYLVAAFCAECGRLLIMSKGKTSLSPGAIIIALFFVLSSIANNSKFGILIIPLAYLMTLWAFGGRVRLSYLFIGVVVAIVSSSYIFPAITVIARQDRGNISADQMVAGTITTIAQMAVGNEDVRRQFELREAARRHGSDASTRYDAPYVRKLPVFFERFMLVPYVDAVARRMTLEGPHAGPRIITSQLKTVLPSFLAPDKRSSYTGNEIVVALRLSQPGFEGFPTMGWPAETFYSGGLLGVIVWSLIIGSLFIAALSLLIGRVSFNLFAVYIVVRYFHLICSGVSVNYFFFISRQLPVDIFLFFVMYYISTRMSPKRRVRRSTVEMT